MSKTFSAYNKRIYHNNYTYIMGVTLFRNYVRIRLIKFKEYKQHTFNLNQTKSCKKAFVCEQIASIFSLYRVNFKK